MLHSDLAGRATRSLVIAAGRSPIVFVLGLGLLFSLATAGNRILSLRWDEHAFLLTSLAVGTLAGWEIVIRTARRPNPLPVVPFLVIAILAGLTTRAIYVTCIQPEWYSDFRSYWRVGEQLAAGGVSPSDSGYTRRANFLTRPLIELFGPNPRVVPYSNILLLTLIQVVAYDLLRRLRSHQAAQAFTLLWVAAPIPIMTAAVPNHDLAGMVLTISATWLCVIAAFSRPSRRIPSAALACCILAGLLVALLEVVRGLGLAYLICLALMTGAGAVIALFPRTGISADGRRLALRAMAGLALVFFGFWLGQSVLGATGNTTDPGLERHARLLYTTPHMNSASNGTYAFRAAFQRAFMDAYHEDSTGLASLRRSLSLTDFTLDPVGRIRSIISRMERQFSLGSEQSFYLRGINTPVQHVLTGYNVLFGTAFAAVLLIAIIRLAQRRTWPPLPESFLLLFTALTAAVLVATGENQPRYISMIWLTGAMAISTWLAESVTAAVPGQERGPVALIASAVAFPLVLLAGAWLAASVWIDDASGGSIFHDWTFASDTGSGVNFLRALQEQPTNVLVGRNDKPMPAHFGMLALRLGLPPEARKANAVTRVCRPPESASLEFHYFGATGKQPIASNAEVFASWNGVPLWTSRVGSTKVPERIRVPLPPVPQTDCAELRFSLESEAPGRSQSRAPAEPQVEIFFPRLVR